jgi:alkanesulfonate monooxygenase SsuD/methylene tetrahydromethanopterin reductase-like flavin-dependent oxidoreductase (luciferase family)
VWLSDALRYRNPWVVATAIAATVPVKVGTAIMVPYFRNPVDVAGTVLALADLTEGREVSVGIAKGSKGMVPPHVQMSKPFGMVEEPVRLMKRLFDGDQVRFRDYPTLAEYFHLNPRGEIGLIKRPEAPVRFYNGGNGPRFMELGGRVMDGLLIGGYYISMLKTGRLKTALALAERGAAQAGPAKKLRKVCELNIAVSEDPERAKEAVKKYAAHHMLSLQAMGYTPEEFALLGVEYREVEALRQALEAGMTIEERAQRLVSDAMVHACFVVGRPKDCVERVAELAEQADQLGFDQISFAKLGHDYAEAIRLLATEVIPALR